ncbi:hypothetical protein [Tetragenococcus halophilus]|uniref:hypothetical protein n=1 Tax=Tetragenococcus halophilus TaxID=51669 RepID=UPI0018D41C6B|nr:hypothetical protein [Tetragenococcus halophilus]
MAETHKCSTDTVHYTWHKEHEPILTIDSGDTVVFKQEKYRIINLIFTQRQKRFRNLIGIMFILFLVQFTSMVRNQEIPWL